MVIIPSIFAHLSGIISSSSMRLFIFIILFCSVHLSFAQIFSATGGDIPDDGNAITFEISVSGLPVAIDTQSFGVEQVCLNIIHTWGADVSVTLIAPDGASTVLFSGIGGDTDGFQDACLSGNAATSIYEGVYPYTGEFRPLGDMGFLNNGQNPNGVWKLLILDTYPFADAGALNNWSITFGNNPCVPFTFASSDLPIVRINTMGQPIPDEPKIDGQMDIIDNGPGNRNFPDQTVTFHTGPIGIETHGNSTQGFPKKSFRVETRDDTGADAEVALMGLPATSDFVLAAQFSDKTLMRNALTYDLSRKLGQYASRTRFCEVLVNGVYQGVYVLTERIKRGDERLDIAKLNPEDTIGTDRTGGYIIKIDWNTTPGWNSQYSQPNSPNNYTYFQYEYPRWDRIAPVQATYIRDYVDSFEVALKSNTFQNPVTGWRRFADEKSFIDFMLINEMSKNVDGYRLSTYFHKNRDDKGGKIAMGPVWDFDLGWLNADYCDAFLPEGWAYNLNYVCADAGIPFWWERLMSDTRFRQNLACRWNTLRATALHPDSVETLVDSMATVLNEAQSRNFRQWPILGSYVWPNPGFLPDTYQGEVDKLKTWIFDRISWMDNTIAAYTPNLNAVFTAAPNGTLDWTFIPGTISTNLIYHWDFGDGSMSSNPTVTHTFPGDGTYTVTLSVSSLFGCTENTQQVILINTSGTNSLGSITLSLFPNPATEQLFVSIPRINSETMNVEIFNALGQSVLVQQIKQGSVDLRGISEGLYRVVVTVDGTRWIGEMVKQ